MVIIYSKELLTLALSARDNAYVPYSNFKVGAALLSEDSVIYTGCNIESASYTPTNCAERTAFFKAVSEGKRKFQAIAIAGGYDEQDAGYCYPCGVCRQVMVEFCNPDTFKIIVVKDINNYKEYLLKDLLPHSFGPSSLN